MYSCPVCKQALNIKVSDLASENSLGCEQGHNFDRHKKGYINLLLAQNKKSKQPGDDSKMVAGRRAFLNAGYYQAFADKIADLIIAFDPKTILDAGCGEGFYLNNIITKANPKALDFTLQNDSCLNINTDVIGFGFDISKPAIAAAASKYKNIEWAVASSARAPYQSAVFDCILSVFSRVESDEFARLLKVGGIVVYAGPGPDHLLALRELIYPEVNAYQAQKHADYFSDNFTLLEQVSLKIPLSINSNEQIMNLLSMTPHGQRINIDAEKRLNVTQTLNDQADFLIYVYQKLS
jgi:23S rRNA (guanine745-N1)-methyltransferase